MKNAINILLVGPTGAGKTKIANFLADLNYELSDDLRSTKTLRIVEFDVDVEVDGGGRKSAIDVRLWDTTGDDTYNYYWAVYRDLAQGIVFVYNPENDLETRKLDLLYNYFVNSKNFNHRACLLCCYIADGNTNNNVKLSSAFSKISEIKVNLELQGEKFRQDFAKFVASVSKVAQN